MLNTIRLYNNTYYGDIPSALDVMADFPNLKSFDVSWNCLSGIVSAKLAPKLTGLDKQGNNCPVVTSTSVQVSTATQSPDRATTSSVTKSSDDSPSSSSNSPPIGPIAGGVAGGLVLIIAAVVAFVFYTRRKRNAVGNGKDSGYSNNAKDDISYIPINIDNSSLPPPPVPLPQESKLPVYTSSASYGPVDLNGNPPPSFEPASVSPPVTVNFDQKESSLFNLPPPALIPFHGKVLVDDKKKPFASFDVGDGNGGASSSSTGGSSGVEAILFGQWGPYMQWNNEQVVQWATELRFGDEFVQSLRERNIDGAILDTIDRETIRTDLGVTDLRLRANVLSSLHRLRILSDPSGLASGGTIGRHVNVVGIDMVHVDLDGEALPPAYNV
ncbi:hypothetical protein HDU76_012274 [Blyttiomyces sp. JEL0837]|nr:hypothetical protein HDU76_012274 [Blyttiomyces sp. JEL0837]